MRIKKYLSIISVLLLPSFTVGCTNNNFNNLNEIILNTKDNKSISLYNPSDIDTNIYQYDKQNILYR